MEVCQNGHDPIVHDEAFCPVCEKQKEIADLEEKIDRLQEELAELREPI